MGFHSMRTISPLPALLGAALLALGACSTGGGTDQGMSGGSMAGDYSLTLELTKFNPHNGQDMGVAVVEADSGKVLAKKMVKVVDNAVTVKFDKVLSSGKSYYVDFYADHNRSGKCDPQAADGKWPDHQWRQSVGAVSQDVTVSMTHNANWTNVCSDFNNM